MSRIANAWRALMGVEPDVIVTEPAADEAEGPLFGLSPPDGCHFDVSYSSTYPPAWFVRIKRGDECLVLECAIGDGRENASHDEKLIVRAAKKALASYERGQGVKWLEGSYPPKSTKGAK